MSISEAVVWPFTDSIIDFLSDPKLYKIQRLTGANRRLKRGLFRSLLRIGILVARTLNTLVKPDFVKRAPSPRMLLDRQ